MAAASRFGPSRTRHSAPLDPGERSSRAAHAPHPPASELWHHIYGELAEDDRGGLVGAVTARAEAQLLRLSVTYALLDGIDQINPDHLEAAYATWRYCAASAAYIFGDSLGDEVADRLLAALRQAGSDGLDGTQQRELFARHVSGPRLASARQMLEDQRLARTTEVATGGRPRTVTVALTDAPKAPKAPKGHR